MRARLRGDVTRHGGEVGRADLLPLGVRTKALCFLASSS